MRSVICSSPTPLSKTQSVGATPLFGRREREQSRWIKIASAFPSSPTLPNRRGVNHTDWIGIDRATYDACVDPRDDRATP